jgi:hypothetical protein
MKNNEVENGGDKTSQILGHVTFRKKAGFSAASSLNFAQSKIARGCDRNPQKLYVQISQEHFGTHRSPRQFSRSTFLCRNAIKLLKIKDLRDPND